MSLLALALAFQVQSPASLVGARNLALSPDGETLAFSYRGDVWIVPSKGGRATPLTTNVEMDDNPVWSPDGESVAFVSNRNGNNDIYISPVEGGPVRRLTYSSGSDVPSDWSPDGKSIALAGGRGKPENGIYLIDVATGKLREVLRDPFAVGFPKFRPDGKSLVYTRFGFPWVRPRYQGSAASQLWATTLDGGRRKLRDTGLQHLWPNPVGNDILCVTPEEVTPSSSPLAKPIGRIVDSKKRTPNVHRIAPNGSATAVTANVGDSPRFLTVTKDGKTMAYEVDGTVFVRRGDAAAAPIRIVAPVDEKTATEERLVLGDGVQDATLSPDGTRVAFTVRNEIWTVPVKKGTGPNKDDATQLTEWPGLDAGALFAPDGKSVFFVSDRDGDERLYRMTLEDRKITPITREDRAVGGLKLTPDKTRVAFWQSGPEGGLFTVAIAGGSPTRILRRPGTYELGNESEFDFSPDGRYVSYRDTLQGSGYYYWESASNVLVLDTRTGKTVNVTSLAARHGSPKFTPDGKYLLLFSDRAGDGIYAVSLRAEEARPGDGEEKYEAPKTPPAVEIEFDGIERRVRRIVTGGFNGELAIDPKTGETILLRDGEIHKAPYGGGDLKKITNGGGIGGFELSVDGESLLLVRSGRLQTLSLRGPGNPTTDVAFRAEWMRDTVAERRAAFDQFWRAYNRSFYDGNFHGRDWVALREKYRKYLPSVGHRNEMATVLNMMVGELESSHSEAGAGPGNPGSVSSAHPGFLVDYGYDGPGLRVERVVPGTPAAFPKTRLEPGDVVLKINGKAVSADESLYREVLNGQTGRDMTYVVRGKDGKQRTVVMRAVSGGEVSGAAFEERLRNRRAMVDKLSGGTIAYVHIAGMSGGELERLNRELWQYAQGKKAVIIDVRNNGGGNTSDRIIDILERRQNSVYVPRDGEPVAGPGQALGVPMVVLHAESSYSNAEMFPSAMKARGLATLVGMPTPGYVIYTYGLTLVDGTSARMPSTGSFRLDGSNMENNGQRPDVRVEITPEQYLRGADPQLEAAVKVLLKK